MIAEIYNLFARLITRIDYGVSMARSCPTTTTNITVNPNLGTDKVDVSHIKADGDADGTQRKFVRDAGTHLRNGRNTEWKLSFCTQSQGSHRRTIRHGRPKTYSQRSWPHPGKEPGLVRAWSSYDIFCQCGVPHRVGYYCWISSISASRTQKNRAPFSVSGSQE